MFPRGLSAYAEPDLTGSEQAKALSLTCPSIYLDRQNRVIDSAIASVINGLIFQGDTFS